MAHVRQSSPTDCGVAALASVMQYYQDPAYSLQALIERYPPASPEGYSLVLGMDDERRKVVTMDPARGPVELDLDDFAASWEKMNHAVLLIGLAAEPD